MSCERGRRIILHPIYCGVCLAGNGYKLAQYQCAASRLKKRGAIVIFQIQLNGGLWSVET
jgi:hypothetical protein